jgi:hypothetical protein
MVERTDDRRITVIVPRDVHRSLKLEAAKQETTVSDIVRNLLDGWLAGLQSEHPSLESRSGSRYPL